MMKPRVFTAAAALALIPALGCNRTQPSDEATRASEEVKAAAGEAGERIADAWLTAKIQGQFFVDDDIKSRYINVTSRDGVVMLKGFVESDDVRRQVLEIARNTDGVRQVDDRELLVGRPASESFETAASAPPEPPSVATTGSTPVAPSPPAAADDATVVSLIQAKYYLDPAIKTRSIDVTAMNGVVTLHGEVASEQERSQALLLARSTPGVQRVEDGLTVNAAAP